MANQGGKESNNNKDFKTMYQHALKMITDVELKNVVLQKKLNASMRKQEYLVDKRKIMKETNDELINLIVKLTQELREKDKIIQTKNDELRNLIEKLTQELREKNKILKTKNDELKQMREDQAKFDQLLACFTDLFENWDHLSYDKMVEKLMYLSEKCSIDLSDMKYIMIGPFIKWSESIINAMYYKKSQGGGITELIQDLELDGFFAKKCAKFGGQCKGSCGDLCCGGSAKDRMLTWRSQRNMMVHRNDERRWMEINEIIQLMRDIEVIVSRYRKQKMKLLINDIDNDDDEKEC